MKAGYDIVVIGGGMVGATVAALLRRHFRIAVVEATVATPFDLRDSIDLRVSALSSASRTLLAAAGCWDAIAAERTSPFTAMHVWDAASLPLSAEALHFECETIGEARLGTIVENRLVQWALHRNLVSGGGVDWIAPARIVALAAGARRATVTLDDGRELRADLVIGADGAASRTRELAGIGTGGYAYDQTAVVTHVRTAIPHASTAWQRFMPDGPLALLPLNDGRCSIVWSTSPQHAAELTGLPDPAFGAAVTAGSDAVLGDVEATTKRAAFPLRLVHALRYASPRIVLVGDAAHAVHPLAGQGVNMGFLDAAALAQVLLEARDDGFRPGDLAVLRRYERWRKGENLATMAALDGLQRLFAHKNPAVRQARRLGFGLVNRAVPLKNTLIRRAMGLDGDLPELVRSR